MLSVDDPFFEAKLRAQFIAGVYSKNEFREILEAYYYAIYSK